MLAGLSGEPARADAVPRTFAGSDLEAAGSPAGDFTRLLALLLGSAAQGGEDIPPEGTEADAGEGFPGTGTAPAEPSREPGLQAAGPEAGAAPGGAAPGGAAAVGRPVAATGAGVSPEAHALAAAASGAPAVRPGSAAADPRFPRDPGEQEGPRGAPSASAEPEAKDPGAVRATRAGWAALGEANASARARASADGAPAGAGDLLEADVPAAATDLPATAEGRQADEASADLPAPVEATEQTGRAWGVERGVAGVVPAGPVPSDVRTAHRAAGRLDPALQEKVERVVERMASEHGIKVTLTEGYRTAERQRFLYAQGRSRRGPVVTWTTRSAHTEGRAADLKVEGSWNQPKAYALLQQVAAEEGLVTLGMKDPGHVELPGDAASPRAPGGAGGAEDAFVPPPQRVASASPVARVAHVARTAEVAAVPRPGSPAALSTAEIRGAAPARRETTVPQDAGHESAAPVAAVGPQGPTLVAAAPAASAGGVRAPEPAPAPAAPVGATPMDGVERVAEVREAQAGAPIQRVTLRLDGVESPVERIRVELLDRALRGGVEISDPVLAQRLREDAGSLLRVLEGRGYTSPTLSVAGVSALAGAGDGGGDLLASLARVEGGATLLRTLMGDAAAPAARTQSDGGAWDQRGREGRPEGSGQDPRKDQRKESR
ncbi:MAG TPA: hypothetical protein VLH75_16800 [Longimicrobiales bacterium]|nr:hypothetical protein [Longimicrobiales bacterium]